MKVRALEGSSVLVCAVMVVSGDGVAWLTVLVAIDRLLDVEFCNKISAKVYI